MMLRTVLEAPLPVAAAVLQTAPIMPEGPAWFVGALSGVWLVVYVLDRFGKLPGKQGDATRADFGKLDRVHELLATEDEDGVPRFLRHVIETHAAVERQAAYVETTAKLHRLIEDHHKLVGMVTDQLRVQNQRIGALEQLKRDYTEEAAG